MMRRRHQRSERGAALVEFALLTPFLLLLTFGIVEFGWLFAQHIDVRHGAREAARMISVDEGGANIVADVCDRMDLSPGTSVTVSRSGNAVRDAATATVSLNAGQNTLTNFFDWAIPSTYTIDSTVETRLQKVPTWTNPTTGTCP
jgi:Flp pilus assembly protein TadG